MKIAVDGLSLTYAPSGFLTYSTNVIRALKEHLSKNENTILDIYVPSEQFLIPPIQRNNLILYESLKDDRVTIHKIDFTNQYKILFGLIKSIQQLLPGDADDAFQLVLYLWVRYVLPKTINGKKYDLLLFLTQMGYKHNDPSIRSVAVVHDIVSWLSYRGKHKQTYIKQKTYFSFLRSLRGFDRIISVSLSTTSDLVGEFGFVPSQITTIYENVSQEYINFQAKRKERSFENTKGAFLKTYDIKPPFILGNNPLNERKNGGMLLEALPYVSAPLSVVFIGNANRKREQDIKKQILSRIDQQKFNIYFVSPESFDDLLLLYHYSACFVSLSYKEGFGLPPLEAMHCGTPVIISRVSSFLEVLKDSPAIFTNPFFPQKIAGEITRMIEMSPQEKKELISRQDKFIDEFNKTYSWKKIGEHFANTLNGVVEKKEKLPDFT